MAHGFNPLAHGGRANYLFSHVVNPPSHDSLVVSGQSTTGGGGSGNRSRRYAVARTVAISRTASARSGSRSLMSGLLGGHPRRCPLCGRAPSGGIIDAVVSASVHYIRSERGRCLIRGRRPRASVNKRRKTEPETQRTGHRGSGTRRESVGQPWWARTERRTETGSSSKNYADAQGGGVNKRACKSLEGGLAPRERHFHK